MVKEIARYLTELENQLEGLYERNQVIEKFNMRCHSDKPILKESAATAASESSSVASDG